MEQGISPQSVERMRGEKLAAAFEHFVTDHTAEDNTGPRLLGERSGEYLVNIPSGMLEDLTLEPIHSLRIESKLLDQDSDPSEREYGISFRNEGKNVFTISHSTGREYKILDANDTCINEAADERIIATLLTLVIDLENMKNVVPISMGGSPAAESAHVITSAMPEAGEVGRTVVRGAGVIVTEHHEADASTEPEAKLTGHALGQNFKGFVRDHAKQTRGSDTDEIAASGLWEIQLPPEMLPIDDTAKIDNVRFEVINDIDSQSGFSTGRQRNAIRFRSGEKAILSLVRTSIGEYFFVRGEGKQASWKNIKDEQAIVKLLADIEGLQTDGNMKPAASAA